MTFDAGKVSLYGTTGVFVAALIIAGMFFSGLRLPSFVPNTGTLTIKLTDAPVNATHLNVTISGLSVHRAGHGWENLTFVDGVSDVYVDLLELQNVTMDLSVTEMPLGNYTMIRMDITTANVTYADDSIDELKVPNTAVKVIVRFEVKAGEETGVLIDVVPDWIAISQSKNLRPVLKATVL